MFIFVSDFERLIMCKMCEDKRNEENNIILNTFLTKRLPSIPEPKGIDSAYEPVKLVQSPYHNEPILKGELGKISKIQEELDELKDAEKQGVKVMVHIELSDLYGAVEFYAAEQGLTMEDLKKFSDLNKRVKSGESN